MPLNVSNKTLSASILCHVETPTAVVAPSARPQYTIFLPHIFSKRCFIKLHAPIFRCSSCDQINSNEVEKHTTEQTIK